MSCTRHFKCNVLDSGVSANIGANLSSSLHSPPCAVAGVEVGTVVGGYITALERMNYNHIVRSMSGDTDFLFIYLFCGSLLQGLKGELGIVKCVLSRSPNALFRLPSDKSKPIFYRITFV